MLDSGSSRLFTTSPRTWYPKYSSRVTVTLVTFGSGYAAGSLEPTSIIGSTLATGFRVLAEDEGEVVVGLVGQPWRPRGGLRTDGDFASFDEPGYAKMVMSFHADGRELVTETRVLLTDAAARRRFRPYWLVIRPFSGLIRRSWLRAARRRVSARVPQ